jgi:hypothetical protein
MKKVILIPVVMLLVACGAGKKEIIEDPIFTQNKILFDERGRASYLVEDPIFPENYILFGSEGKEAYIVADPIFDGNYLVFPEPK